MKNKNTAACAVLYRSNTQIALSKLPGDVYIY